MRRNKKASLSIGLIIIALGIAAIGFIMLKAKQNQGHEYFNRIYKTLAQRLYDGIVSYDFTSDYPSAPEDVIEFNNNVNLLFYGNMLLDNTLVGALLSQQRYLYADSLIESVPYNDQYDSLLKGLDEYKKNKTVVYNISYQPARRFDDTLSVVKVTWVTNNMGKIDWNYYLIQDEQGRYKIYSFEAVK